jgi:hypothetical protein
MIYVLGSLCTTVARTTKIRTSDAVELTSMASTGNGPDRAIGVKLMKEAQQHRVLYAYFAARP